MKTRDHWEQYYSKALRGEGVHLKKTILDLNEKLAKKKRDEAIEGVLPDIVAHEFEAHSQRAVVYKEVSDVLRESQDIFTDVLMRFKDHKQMIEMVTDTEKAFQRYIFLHKRVYPGTKEASTIKYDIMASEILELVTMRRDQLKDYLKDYI